MKDRTIDIINKIMHRVIKYIHRQIPHPVKVGDIKFKMSQVDLGSTLDKSLHRYGNYEPWLNLKMIETLKKDDVIYNIGAYRGYYSLLLNEIVSSPKNIYSFEPDPYNSRALKKNISKTTLIKKCVSDNDVNGNISLDNFFDNNLGYKKPTALKIDVDGAEIKLIRGCVKLIENYRPKIFMEVHPIHIHKLEDKGIEAMFDILYSHYKVMYMKNHWGRVKGYDEWNGKGTHEWEETDKDKLINYCYEIINDNIDRKAAIYNNRVLPRGFVIFCS